MLGATEVVGSDIDPAAVEVARENASRSGFDIQFFIGAGFGPVVNLRDEAGGIWGEDEIDLQGKDLTSEQAVVGSDAAFDIVLSNIISMILIKLAEDAYRAIKPGGSWIVSGIIQQNWPDVLQKATEAGFSLIEMRGEDDWIGAHFRK
jgi:ribosomal protein L11 methyltransferase